jgi:glycosyltransferase involved in cell wall biosynthesis
VIHAVVPENIDDPALPSGGNVYDRRVLDLLPDVVEHKVPLDRAHLTGIPGPILADGLVVRVAPDLFAGATVLAHLPVPLPPRATVITTSRWTLDRLGVPGTVAHPGVDPAPVARGGGGILCVGAVIAAKGQHVLAEALAGLPLRCVCVGSLTREPAYAAAIPLAKTGPLTGTALAAAYDTADLLVLPSFTESYGMVITEALARGIPVIASDVGGVREALGGAGLLVPPGDVRALRAALRSWVSDPGPLRAAALRRRPTLPTWAETAATIARVLNQ